MIITFLFIGCGSTKNIEGVTYDTQGLISTALGNANPKIEYKPIWGNIIWGAILFTTVIAPVYFYGFSMFEPVGIKNPDKIRGSI